MTKSQSKGKIKQELSPCPIITGIFYGVVGGMFVGLGGIDDIIAATSFIPSLSPLIAGVIICVGCLGLMAITSYSIFRFCRHSITLSTTRDIVEQAICTGINLGIEAGLVALGFTSSVAGVLTALAGSIACISFSLLVDKVIERFSSPSGSSVDSNVKVDNTPPSPSYGLPNY